MRNSVSMIVWADPLSVNFYKFYKKKSEFILFGALGEILKSLNLICIDKILNRIRIPLHFGGDFAFCFFKLFSNSSA